MFNELSNLSWEIMNLIAVLAGYSNIQASVGVISPLTVAYQNASDSCLPQFCVRRNTASHHTRGVESGESLFLLSLFSSYNFDTFHPRQH